mmetsp:Transcript_21665/g.84340  ORF Transcript_21665/g.84340 Transcript_21665/m.84340 type:complete len:844 (+) Transcript_21665:834-3365(+)
MEDLAGRGRLHDLHVVVRGQLHEALQAGRAVLGALAFIAVRQHHHEAIGAAPLHFTRRDELVDDDLGAVDEVAELGFPDGQRVRLGGGIAVLKAQHRFFGQDGVDHGERRLAVRHVLQRDVGAVIPAAAVLVVQHRVAVGEGATAAVLAGQAHRVARRHQRREGHALAHAPVDVDLAPAHRGAIGVELGHEVVRREVLGQGRQLLGQALPLGDGDGGVTAVGPLLAEEGRPVGRELALEVGQHRVDGVAAFVHRGAVDLDHLVRAFGRQHALGDQLVGIDLAGAGVGTDLLVHQRLGERRRVLLVVAQLAVADDVQHHVLLELGAVVHAQLHGPDDGFGVVAVHVQHRRLDHLDDIGAVPGRAQVARVAGGEADLVVDDDVDRAARAVAAGLAEGQGLLHHALATEGRVAVYQHRQHLGADLVAAAILAGAHAALHHRVDDLEVGRVEGQRQMHRTARGGHVGAEALVVLHVTGRQVFGGLVLELGEQIGGHLAQGVDQHVQAAAVGHADDDLLHAALAGTLDQLVHRGDEALTAFEREALLADVLGVQIALQALGGGQAVEDVLLLVGAEAGLAARLFEALLPPALFGRVGAVHEFGADAAAVGLAQGLHDLAQRHGLAAEVAVHGAERDVHVGLGQVVERGVEFGDLGALGALERVQLGPAVAEEAVGRDQRLDMDLLAGHRQVGAAGLGGEGIGLGALGEGFDDRRVSHVAGLGAVDRRHVLQRVEVGAPVVRHGARVVEVGLVHLLHIRRIATEQVGVGPVLLHHLSLTSCPGFQGVGWLKNLPRHGSTGWRIATHLRCCQAKGTGRTISLKGPNSSTSGLPGKPGRLRHRSLTWVEIS